MKPERAAGDRFDYTQEVVAACDVRAFVSEDRFQLRAGEFGIRGNDDDRTEQPDRGRRRDRLRTYQPHRIRHACAFASMRENGEVSIAGIDRVRQ